MPEEHRSPRTLQRGLALVLVGSIDRRVVPAIRFAAQLPDHDIVALHIALDPTEAHRLGREWMAAGLSRLPLRIEDPAGTDLATAVRSVVEDELTRRSRVLVVVPELGLTRRWELLLHRSTGRQLATRLQGVRRASTVVLPYAVG